jgi:predicted Zn-dependent protease with MMP-like domain
VAADACSGTPDAADFERLVDDAIASIPAQFREQLHSVAIVIEDEPTADQLAAVRAHGLFGLYQGVPRTVYGADGATIASKITIFRGPLERAHPDPRDLAAAVRDTVRHEVAHHLGIGDPRLHQLRQLRARPRA